MFRKNPFLIEVDWVKIRKLNKTQTKMSFSFLPIFDKVQQIADLVSENENLKTELAKKNRLIEKLFKKQAKFEDPDVIAFAKKTAKFRAYLKRSQDPTTWTYPVLIKQ
jgi:hypothetical protein